MLTFLCLATDIGANASTEDAAEDLEAGSRAVIDVVDAFQLVNIGPMPNMAPKEAGKKEESEYFQLYLKRKVFVFLLEAAQLTAL